MTIQKTTAVVLIALAAGLVPSGRVAALDGVELRLLRAEDDARRRELVNRITSTSLTFRAYQEETTNPQDVLGSARSDYARIVGVLYEEGYYGPSVSVLIDGREAADIDPFRAPSSIRNILIVVDPGSRFRFRQTSIAPRAPGSSSEPLVQGFAPGEIARADLVGTAANNAVTEWREIGHAKAAVGEQNIIADHASRRLDVDIEIEPSRRLRFGDVRLTGQSRISEPRLREMLGWPQGEVFSPEELNKSVGRMRRSGVFSTVSATEAEVPNADDTLDYTLALVDQKLRRFGFSAEYSTLDGILVGGFWLHRNLFGNGERFRIDGQVSNIAGSDDGSGIDYTLNMRLTRPATFGADNDAFVFGNFERNDEPDYIETEGTVGIGLSRYFSDQLYGEVAGGLRYSDVEDGFGHRTFAHFVMPSRLEWDTRNEPGDATEGFFLGADAQPYIGFSGSESGLRTLLDGRTYYGIGSENRLILAGRLQLGSIFGSDIRNTPPDFLFFSGGGDTVRGYPFKSLGATVDGVDTGGRSFVGLSGELRGRATQSIGVVAFYDAGYIGTDSFYDESAGEWQAGAGIGVRYATPIGPLRVDIATPVEGARSAFSTAELYIGVGQAF